MTDTDRRHAAVILAGGQARRMGGVPKPELLLGGRSLVQRVLDAVPGARPQVVVGDIVARGFIVTTEDKPGSGPAYALAAGLSHVPETVPLVAVLAADLPFLSAEVMDGLVAAVTPGYDGAVLIDHHYRRQWLCGVWRQSVLRERLAEVKPGMGMRQMVGALRVAELSWLDSDLPPWFDCDTPQALEYARRLDLEFPPTRALPPPKTAPLERHVPAAVDVQGDAGDVSGLR